MPYCIARKTCYYPIHFILLQNCDNLPHCHENYNVVVVVCHAKAKICVFKKYTPVFFEVTQLGPFDFLYEKRNPKGQGGSPGIG